MNVSTMERVTAVDLQEKLKRYCLYLTENHWDAEDLAQETWVKALSTAKLEHHSNPEALLLRIAKNSWVDHTRRLKLRMRYMEQEKKRIVAASEPGLGQIEMVFQALLKHMTPLQRAVFLLKEVYDYSNNEIALKLDTTQGAVKAALHRARQALGMMKHELDGDSLVVEEEFKSLLSSLARAYEIGDVERVLALAMEGEVEAITAIAIAHNQSMKVNATAKKRVSVHYIQQSMAA